MKSRILWAAVLLGAFAAFYFGTIRPAMTPTPMANRGPVGQRPTPFIPPSVMKKMDEFVMPPIRIPTPPIVPIRIDPPALKMEVPIQNGATIDFSIGSPVVKMQGQDQETLERALKEMAEATKDKTFPPTK